MKNFKYCDKSVENLEMLKSIGVQKRMPNEMKLMEAVVKRGEHFILPYNGYSLFDEGEVVISVKQLDAIRPPYPITMLQFTNDSVVKSVERGIIDGSRANIVDEFIYFMELTEFVKLGIDLYLHNNSITKEELFASADEWYLITNTYCNSIPVMGLLFRKSSLKVIKLETVYDGEHEFATLVESEYGKCSPDMGSGVYCTFSSLLDLEQAHQQSRQNGLFTETMAAHMLSLIMAFQVAIDFCIAVNCKNIKQTVVKPSGVKNAIRRSKKVLPLSEFKVLTVNSEPIGYYDKKEVHGTHASPKCHKRKGHLRHYKDGTVIWIRNMVVGARTNGTVDKIYKVKHKSKQNVKEFLLEV